MFLSLPALSLLLDDKFEYQILWPCWVVHTLRSLQSMYFDVSIPNIHPKSVQASGLYLFLLSMGQNLLYQFSTSVWVMNNGIPGEIEAQRVLGHDNRSKPLSFPVHRVVCSFKRKKITHTFTPTCDSNHFL